MQNKKEFLLVVSILLLSIPTCPVYALTIDYITTAEALAEVGFYGFFGLIAEADYDIKKADNAQAYASAYYDEIQFMGGVGVSALAEATVEPNEVILSTRINGSYEFDVGWELMEYFYQDANSTIEGLLRIDEYPIGSPCRLQINISLPQTTWTGGWFWQLYIESSVDYFIAGRDTLGDYGSPSGTIDAFAGEAIYVFLGIAGGGYADHYIGDSLGYGIVAVNADLKAIPHVADLNSDGWIDFGDFALFSLHWNQKGCEDPNTNWCQRADFDFSGNVDANDLHIFTQYWLLSSDPNEFDNPAP